MPLTVSEGGEWIERLAIADLIYRYSDSVTRADWDQTEAVFAQGCDLGEPRVEPAVRGCPHVPGLPRRDDRQ